MLFLHPHYAARVGVQPSIGEELVATRQGDGPSTAGLDDLKREALLYELGDDFHHRFGADDCDGHDPPLHFHYAGGTGISTSFGEFHGSFHISGRHSQGGRAKLELLEHIGRVVGHHEREIYAEAVMHEPEFAVFS